MKGEIIMEMQEGMEIPEKKILKESYEKKGGINSVRPSRPCPPPPPAPSPKSSAPPE